MSSSPSSNVRERLSFAANALRTAVTSSDTPDELADWFRPGYLLEVAADIERLLAEPSAPALEGARDATGVLRTEEAPSEPSSLQRDASGEIPRCPACSYPLPSHRRGCTRRPAGNEGERRG